MSASARPIGPKARDLHVAGSGRDAGDRDAADDLASTATLRDPDEFGVPAVIPAAPAQPKSWWMRWGTLFWSAVGGLVVLGLGLSVVKLVTDLFSYSQSLGYFAAVLAGIAGLALARDPHS